MIVLFSRNLQCEEQSKKCSKRDFETSARRLFYFSSSIFPLQWFSDYFKYSILCSFDSVRSPHNNLLSGLFFLQSSFPNLQRLSLSHCRKFTEKGLLYLSSGKGCHKLRYLDLSGCIQVCRSRLSFIL